MISVEQKIDERPKLVFDQNRLVEVIIGKGPFRMYFKQRRGRTSLDWFERFDGSLDDEKWIPNHFFFPATSQARAIFAKYRQQRARHF